MTGYFEGTELKPVVMHYVTESLIWNVVEEDDRFSLEGGTSSFLLSQLDKAELLDWQLQFDHSDAYEKDSLVTVYITYPEMWSSSDDPLTYGEQPYENLAALTQALDLPLKAPPNITVTVVFPLRNCCYSTIVPSQHFPQMGSRCRKVKIHRPSIL